MLATGSTSDAGASAVAVILIIVGIVGYWVPTIVALARSKKIPNVGSIIVINVFLGWSVIGWVVAMAMAVRSAPRPMMQMPMGQWPAPPSGPMGQWPPLPPGPDGAPSGYR